MNQKIKGCPMCACSVQLGISLNGETILFSCVNLNCLSKFELTRKLGESVDDVIERFNDLKAWEEGLER